MCAVASFVVITYRCYRFICNQYFPCFNRKREKTKALSISKIIKNKTNLQGLLETDFGSVGKNLYLTIIIK